MSREEPESGAAVPALSLETGARTPQAASLSQLLDVQRSTGLHIRVAFICAAVAFCDGFGVQAINYAGPSLRDALRLTPGQLGAIFSASLAGMTIGSFAIGPIADRLGRRWPLIFLTAAFGLLTGAVSIATTFWQVLILRFLDGLALGSALPNAYVLVAEYSPLRHRRLTIGLAMLGYSIGGATAGACAASVITQFGWGALFLLGGAFALLTAIAVFLWVPDSIHMMIRRPRRLEEAKKILVRTVPHFDPAILKVLPLPRPATVKATIGAIFSDDMRVVTLCLWVISFTLMGAALLFLSWTPIIMKDLGLSLADAIGVTVAFTIGSMVMSVGGGWLTDRYNPPLVIAICAVIGCLPLAGLGTGLLSIPATYGASFLVGAGIGGGLAGMNVLATTCYPETAKVTGSGWAIGIGRLGAVCGPLIGAGWMASKMREADLFYVTLLICLISVAASLLMFRMSRSKDHSSQTAAL